MQYREGRGPGQAAHEGRGDHALEAAGIHTSYALQNHYEPLLRTIGVVAPSELASATERMMGMGDPRDVQAAYHSLRQLIRVA
jgi:hypothetical protein